ncbi:hypothetical protein OPT61_g8327 [Boeremia exigua]|uniref:Uncharacterized protein n=1 Tax=Boeremia exigua TaxID=749465 RepID=A0ACC2HYX9_9PLEO|nr:hypothetical protein OPT61_g8327 [Boeremia exigua]
MAILRDDLAGRLHRTAIRFPKTQPEDEDEMPFAPDHDVDEAMDIDLPAPQTVQPHPEPPVDTDTQTARALTRTILSQSHLSPFPLSARPLHWDFAHALGLYPLPTSLVLADTDAPAFVVKYCGCTVMNPGSIDVSRGSKGREGRSRHLTRRYGLQGYTSLCQNALIASTSDPYDAHCSNSLDQVASWTICSASYVSATTGTWKSGRNPPISTTKHDRPLDAVAMPSLHNTCLGAAGTTKGSAPDTHITHLPYRDLRAGLGLLGQYLGLPVMLDDTRRIVFFLFTTCMVGRTALFGLATVWD